MKSQAIVTLADSNYFELLLELVCQFFFCGKKSEILDFNLPDIKIIY